MTAAISAILTSTGINLALKSFKPLYNSIKKGYSFSIHNSKLIHSLHNIGTVKTLFFGANHPVELNDFFINPNIQLEYGNKKTIQKIKSLNDLYQNNDASQPNILITGTVGQGKSILMRYLALQELSYGKIPLFIEFKYINGKNTLEKLIDEVFQNWLEQASKENIKSLLNSGNITLFLDAFDELPAEHLTVTMQAIDMYCRDFPNLQIVISSRPDHNISQHAQFKSISLLPYGLDEQNALVDKLVSDQESRQLLHQQIEASDTGIQEVLTTPLMVGLFIQKYLRNFSTPENIVDFYKDIFDLVTDKHNKTKTGFVAQSKSGLNNSDLEKIFTRFCFETARKSILVLDKDSYIEILDFATSKSIIAPQIMPSTQLIAEDFEKYVCFILNDVDQYTFIHRNIQEFYVAKFISKLNEKHIETVVNIRIINSNDGIFDFLQQLNQYYFDKFFLLPKLGKLKQTLQIADNFEPTQEALEQISLLFNFPHTYQSDNKDSMNICIFSYNFTVFLNDKFITPIIKPMFDFIYEKYSNQLNLNIGVLTVDYSPESIKFREEIKENPLINLVFTRIKHMIKSCKQRIEDKENEINDVDLGF